MLTTNRVSGSALVLFALLVIWESRQLPLGNFSSARPRFCSGPACVTACDLRSSSHSLGAPRPVIIFAQLDRVAPRAGDLGHVRLCRFRHRASWLPPHHAACADISSQACRKARLGIVFNVCLRLVVWLVLFVPFSFARAFASGAVWVLKWDNLKYSNAGIDSRQGVVR